MIDPRVTESLKFIIPVIANTQWRAINVFLFDFWQARGSGKVPVSYTNPKFLQKVKGGKPGMVKVEKESVLLGRASAPPEAPQLIATA